MKRDTRTAKRVIEDACGALETAVFNEWPSCESEEGMALDREQKEAQDALFGAVLDVLNAFRALHSISGYGDPPDGAVRVAALVWEHRIRMR